ncbi:MAG: acyltransferase [Bacillales bacterium]|nr:acyltransferase [Bacillales bacterium]
MNSKRNYGIDLLRILATFMIIVLHILGVGGVIYTIDSSSPVYIIAWLLEFAAYCAVNCYALISGYVGVNSKFRVSNILFLWIQVVFTTVVITTGFYCAGIDVSLADVKQSCTPITSQLYWYFTAYVCLYFLTPFLNRFIANLNKKMACYLLVVLMILFSFVPILWETDLFFVNNGYSAAWLIILYLVGGVIRKFYSEIKIKKRILFLGYLLAVILTLLSKLGIEYLTERSSFALLGNHFLMNYNSPTMVLAGVCMLLLFANLKVDKFVKIIAFYAPFTFGVYIIHVHPFVWNNILSNRFTGYTSFHPIALVFAVLLTAIIIFLTCSMAEFLRIQLFRILHVKQFCDFIEEKTKNIFERFLKDDRENNG